MVARVYERAKGFLRVGADINLTPNPVRALDGLGVGAAVLEPAARPARLERASQIQVGSRGNQWLKAGGNADWVYGYDAWGVALV